jgi:hypothetical protein
MRTRDKIRIYKKFMDFAELFALRLAEAIIAKHEMNEGREHKHGGKAF